MSTSHPTAESGIPEDILINCTPYETRVAVLAMALKGQLEHGRLGEAVAMDHMDTKTLLQGLTETAVSRFGDEPPAVGHHLQGPDAFGQ
jgi:hypothetical protein